MEERAMYAHSQGKRLRGYMTTVHLFTMFIGLFIISIGAYHINSTTSLTLSLLFMCLGGMMTMISFIGSFGVQLEHIGFLNTYNTITAILLLFEIVIISIVYDYRSKIDPYASKLWDFFIRHDPQFIKDLEELSQCCGYDSVIDRAVPANCSLSLNVNIGCKESVISRVQEWHHWIILILTFLLVLQFFLLILSVIMSLIVNRQLREEETCISLLNNNHYYHHRSLLNEGPSTNSGYFGRHRANFQIPKSHFIPKYGSTPSTSSATHFG